METRSTRDSASRYARMEATHSTITTTDSLSTNADVYLRDRAFVDQLSALETSCIPWLAKQISDASHGRGPAEPASGQTRCGSEHLSPGREPRGRQVALEPTPTGLGAGNVRGADPLSRDHGPQERRDHEQVLLNHGIRLNIVTEGEQGARITAPCLGTDAPQRMGSSPDLLTRARRSGAILWSGTTTGPDSTPRECHITAYQHPPSDSPVTTAHRLCESVSHGLCQLDSPGLRSKASATL
jgi:hypothetical protein